MIAHSGCVLTHLATVQLVYATGVFLLFSQFPYLLYHLIHICHQLSPYICMYVSLYKHTHAKQDTQVKQLQAKIDHECLMRDGTVKLLQASTNERQAIHASKTLFVCNTKILTLMSDLQKAKAVAQGGTESR